MNAPSLPKPLSGIIVPLVTPLLDPERLDPAALERIVEHLIVSGVHGLFILGSTGEGPSLPPEIRHAVIRQVCVQVAGRRPVLVGISDTCLAESLHWAEAAAHAGASAVVLAPPYYLSVSQLELLHHVETLAARLPLPLFLYNAPSFTRHSFAPETVRALADLPAVAGLKDSSGDRIYFHQVKYLLGDRKDFSMLVGPEELLADLLLWGGHGGVSGGAHLWPQLYTGICEAAWERDLDRVRRLHELIMFVNTRIYGVSKAPSSVFKAIKCCLSLRGVCKDVMAPPLEAFGQAERDALTDLMEQMDGMLAREVVLAD